MVSKMVDMEARAWTETNNGTLDPLLRSLMRCMIGNCCS
jgi:hypothetical protein